MQTAATEATATASTPREDANADAFGFAEDVTVQEALLRGSPVGSGSQLAGSVPTPPQQQPEPYIDAGWPRDWGRRRVAELRGYGADYLVDLDLFAPRYTGAEDVWSDNSLAWIAYASHEGTVAFGVLLATALTAQWPDIRRWHWSGW